MSEIARRTDRDARSAATDRPMKLRPPDQRLMWPDGRYVPRSGDLARMLETVTLEGGGKLPAGQNVLVQHVIEDVPEVVGIKWRDDDGTHVMAMDVIKLEVVP